MAGGTGSRLNPLTLAISKHLLPVFDKPLIFYPLSTLMLAQIREVAIITTPDQKRNFEKLLGDGSSFGIQLTYFIQEKPKGIADSFQITQNFIKDSKSALILGDNIFHGPGMGRRLVNFTNIKGAFVFGYSVKNPERYGIADLNESGKIIKLVEKPQNSNSKIAIPGLYFLDENVTDISSKILPSRRNELEILDVLESYRNSNELELEMLPRGTAWFDAGTFKDLSDAGNYVRVMQERTGEVVGDPVEIARLNKWI